jgi:hypothetical protein
LRGEMEEGRRQCRLQSVQVVFANIECSKVLLMCACTVLLCYDLSKFFIPPPSFPGPSAAAAPAPLAQHHYVHPLHYVTPAQPSVPAEEHLLLYHQYDPQTTYYTIEPLDHIMEDVEPGAASPRDMDMQGPTMPKTLSPDSDGLPFHPKYLWAPGRGDAMSPAEFRRWLCSNLLAPSMHDSQPTSSGGI